MSQCIGKKLKEKDGAWDKKRNTYTVSLDNGITTEISLQENPTVQTGFAVNERSYKQIIDQSGKSLQVDVRFDQKINQWVQQKGIKDWWSGKSGSYMGSLMEYKQGKEPSTYSLIIEKSKPIPPPQVIMSPNISRLMPMPMKP